MSRPVLFPIVVVLALVAAACGATPSPTPGGPTAPPGEPTPTGVTATPPTVGGRLATVKQRGQLICGVNGGQPGFSFLEEGTGTWSGFDVDFCRAVATAVLGDPDAVQFRALSTDDRGPALQTGEIDVLIRNTTWTVTRDAQWGLFAPTTFYDGQGMMVRASVGATTLEDLGGATVCLQSGTTTELNLADAMRVAGHEGNYTTQIFDNIDETYSTYEAGRCDAVTSDRSQLVSRRTQMANPAEHILLDVVMSKEPLGPAVPLGDDAWFNVVKWVVFATFEAEEQGITQANVTQLRDTSDNPVVQRLLGTTSDNPVVQRLLGTDPEQQQGVLLGLTNDWVVNVISAVGNYAEIYERNVGPNTALGLDRGLNRLWTDGGILYAPPYR